MASKRSQRSDLPSDLKFMAQTTHKICLFRLFWTFFIFEGRKNKEEFVSIRVVGFAEAKKGLFKHAAAFYTHRSTTSGCGLWMRNSNKTRESAALLLRRGAAAAVAHLITQSRHDTPPPNTRAAWHWPAGPLAVAVAACACKAASRASLSEEEERERERRRAKHSLAFFLED